MRYTLQPSYVLHQRPYRETSLLLEIFSLEHGRLGLVARGARRGKSGWRALLQAFRPLLLSWSGRGELCSLVGAEPGDPMPQLQGHALLSAFYVNELLMRLLHRHEPHPELYQAYQCALVSLAGHGEAEQILRIFEKRLLEAIGYGLILDTDVASGQPVLPGRKYVYGVEQGPSSAPLGSQGGVLLDGETLVALERERLDSPEIRVQAKALMRYVLAVYLGDKPLASRELFR